MQNEKGVNLMYIFKLLSNTVAAGPKSVIKWAVNVEKRRTFAMKTVVDTMEMRMNVAAIIVQAENRTIAKLLSDT